MKNVPNSHRAVVSTITLVMESLINAVRVEIPEVTYVYDERLTLESSLEKFRSDNNMRLDKQVFYPAFTFKRSVLQYVPEGASKRVPMVTRTSKVAGTDTSDVYVAVHAQADFDFVYYAKSAEDFERFEVAYLAEEGISAIKQLDVDLVAETGKIWNYYVHHQPLQDKVVASDNIYYKAVAGKFTVKGFYLLFRENSKHIKTINLKAQTFLTEVLFQDIIT